MNLMIFSIKKQRREISEDRAKLEELRAKCKIREETYKVEIDKLRQKLDKIRYKFESQQQCRQNSQEMQRIKEENLFLKSQVQYQKQQIQQSFQINNMLQTSRETSSTKRAQSSRSTHDKQQNLNNQSNNSGYKVANSGVSHKKLIASEIELVKIAQHKLMKENKNLKKRVDIMQTQMKDLYELLLDEKLGNPQLQGNQQQHVVQNYLQLVESLKQNSNVDHDINSAITQKSQFLESVPLTVPFDQTHQQNQLQVSGFSNIKVSGERSSSPIYQNDQNILNGEQFDDKFNNAYNVNKNEGQQNKIGVQNKKFNFAANNNQRNGQAAFVSPQSQTTEQQDNQLNEFSERIELTKSKFIDKIKNVFQKHQKQNEIFENNNKKMKEMTKQLFEPRNKSDNQVEQHEKDIKEQSVTSMSSLTSLASSINNIDNDINKNNKQQKKQKNKEQKQQKSKQNNQIEVEQQQLSQKSNQQQPNQFNPQNQQQNQQFSQQQNVSRYNQQNQPIQQKQQNQSQQNQKFNKQQTNQQAQQQQILQQQIDSNYIDSFENELIVEDDESKNEYSNEVIKNDDKHQEDMKNSHEYEYSSALKKQMNFLKRQDSGQEDEQISADFDYTRKQNQGKQDNGQYQNTQKYPSSQYNQKNNLDNSYDDDSKQQLHEYQKQHVFEGKTKPKSNQSDQNIISFNETSTKNFKRESGAKGEDFRAVKEQFSSLLNNNINNNNTSNNLNNTTGMSTMVNNYLSHAGYVQDIPATTARRCDPLNQFQVQKNYTSSQYPSNQYPNTQYPTSSTIANYNRQYSNSNYPSQHISGQNNIINSLDHKNQDSSGSFQAQNLTQKFNQSNTTRNTESQRNTKPLDLEYIGHSAQISPLKEPTLTSRQKDDIYLNFPSSTQSQSIHQQGQNKDAGSNSTSNKNYETSKLTTPLMQTQNEKITDEYIKQIIQQYKTPKKTSISSQQQTFQQQPQYNQQPGQSNIGAQQKRPNQQEINTTHQQNYERREQSQPLSYNKPQTPRVYEKDISSNKQQYNNNQKFQNGTGQSQQNTGVVTSNVNSQQSPNQFSKTNKLSIQSTTPTSNNIINSNNMLNINSNPSAYSKDLTIYNCYFNNNSPIQKKITNIQPPLPGNQVTTASSTNRESLNLNHKRQQSCGTGGVSGVNKYNLKLNLTSLVSPKSSQMLQSDRQNSDRTGYNRLLSKNSGMVSSNISPKYSPISSQATSNNRIYQK